MPEATVKRTLVKSPPELWAEISDADALARHLGEFGEIRITRTDPETTVAWEGDRARGTVEIEGSGWGTKVTLTAKAVEAAAEPAEVPAAAIAAEPEPAMAEVDPPTPAEAPEEPVAVEEPPRSITPEPPEAAQPERPTADSSPSEPVTPAKEPKKPGFWARLFGRKPAAAPEASAAEPAPEPRATEPAPDPAPVQAPVHPLTSAEPEPVEPPPAAVADVPEPIAPPEAEPVESPPAAASVDPVPTLDAARTEEILNGVLDDLGAAHHRPFSR